jgi:hypothetical protein
MQCLLIRLPQNWGVRNLLELIESTYASFRDRQGSIHRFTTCTCNACRQIPSLDLKFVLHYGGFVHQMVSQKPEMVGTDVNLVHRLLKSNAHAATGWRAYALFTAQSLVKLGLTLTDARVRTLDLEHFGKVITHTINLRARYEEMLSDRRIFVRASESDFTVRVDIPAPPPVAWEWIHDPVRRNLWSGGPVWTAGDRPGDTPHSAEPAIVCAQPVPARGEGTGLASV